MRKTIRHLIEIAAFLIAGLVFSFSDKPILKIIGIILLITASIIALWLVIPWKKVMKAFLRLFKKRKISTTILFTDIVGYNALKEQDEEKASHLLEKNRYILKPLIKQYNGTWIKETVDCTISRFKSTIDAVNCALEIQRILSIDHELNLRIGIHRGEVWIVGNDNVIGDGIKVASGIEPFAEPGGICVSEDIFNNIRNIPGMESDFLGEKTLKSVDHPIKVYALKIGKGTEPLIKSSEVKPKPSIAVLPFIDMSTDPEQEYFCDGMTEEIINALTHVEKLRVIARTSAFFFKGKNVKIHDIGKELNVETVLGGSVRKSDNRLRITAQLIYVADESHIWSERYDREMEDIFAIQDEISLAIVEALKVKLLKKEEAVILKRHTENLEAYNLYLKGNYYWQMMIMEGFDKAIECYKQALKKDPNYALAYVGLASVYGVSSYWGNVPPNEAYPRAKEYVKKALEIDDSLAEAHASLGFINMNYDWNWKAAEREFKQALQLNPNSAFTHCQYYMLLTFAGRHEDAITEAKRAQELDPLSSFINSLVGDAFFYAAQYDRAIEELQMTLVMNPNDFLAHFRLGLAYWGKLMIEEAIAEHEKAVDLSGGNPHVMTWLANAYYESGKKEKAEKLLNSLKQRQKDEYVPSICFYLIHKARDDQDQALEWLERACNEHDSNLPWYRVFPIDKYRIPDEPRFKALLKKAGLE